MSSPLDNLAKVSKGGLKLEAPNQAELDGVVRSAKRKLLDAATPTLGLESAFDLLATPRTPWRWQPCAGMAIGLKTATWCFRHWRTRWVSPLLQSGACSISATASVSRNSIIPSCGN